MEESTSRLADRGFRLALEFQSVCSYCHQMGSWWEVGPGPTYLTRYVAAVTSALHTVAIMAVGRGSRAMAHYLLVAS